MRNFYIEQSSNRYTVNGDVKDWVSVPFNEADYGAELLRRHRLRTHVAVRPRLGRTPGTTRRSRPARPQLRSTPTSRSSTSGIATTTTATATSTSRTATSTTSSRSMPARARRPAAAPRAPTRSGATAGTPSTTGIGADRPGPQQARRRADRRARTSGSATTPSSRRTAASACSRTSSATTSACPTCTTPSATPVAPRTRPASGRSGRSGSYGTTATADGIGDQPIHMSAWEKIFLGWLELRARRPRARRSVGQARPGRGQHEAGRRQRRRAARQGVTVNVGIPVCRARVLLLGLGQRPRQRMSEVGRPRRPGRQLSREGALRHRAGLGLRLPRRLTTAAPRGPRADEPVDEHQPERPELRQRASPALGRNWVDLTADLSAYAGQTVSSASATGPTAPRRRTGLSASTTSRSPAATDGAETDARLDLRAGYRRVPRTTGTGRSSYFNAYFAEYRQYLGYDDGRSRPARTTSASSNQPELGRALPVPGRPAGLVLRHLVRRQQRRAIIRARA